MKQKILLIAVLFITILFSSCGDSGTKTPEKEPVLGCTQINACNYAPVATEDDGSCTFCSDCSGNTIENSSVFQSIDVNLFDLNPSSSYFNQVFSTLNVTWYKQDYCIKEENEFYTSFKNVTNKTVTFDYLIQSNANGQIRSTQGFIQNLAPGDTFTKLAPNNSFWNLKTYPVTVRINNIKYN
ncbi:hypothetical protein [uncultured Polaribacter sp.]|uniref:hypothetical protein n=1 Tax=uncultured Polaribacter sp. TaxID=174711 RepID=UPI00261A3F91|nr:hypothetical protein [uncultured Polaribacter sp.]